MEFSSWKTVGVSNDIISPWVWCSHDRGCLCLLSVFSLLPDKYAILRGFEGFKPVLGQKRKHGWQAADTSLGQPVTEGQVGISHMVWQIHTGDIKNWDWFLSNNSSKCLSITFKSSLCTLSLRSAEEPSLGLFARRSWHPPLQQKRSSGKSVVINISFPSIRFILEFLGVIVHDIKPVIRNSIRRKTNEKAIWGVRCASNVRNHLPQTIPVHQYIHRTAASGWRHNRP